MSKSRIMTGAILAAATALGLQVSAARAQDDAAMKAAKDYIATVTAPVTE